VDQLVETAQELGACARIGRDVFGARPRARKPIGTGSHELFLVYRDPIHDREGLARCARGLEQIVELPHAELRRLDQGIPAFPEHGGRQLDLAPRLLGVGHELRGARLVGFEAVDVMEQLVLARAGGA
jgi:hypothetical protein